MDECRDRISFCLFEKGYFPQEGGGGGGGGGVGAKPHCGLHTRGHGDYLKAGIFFRSWTGLCD